MPLEDARGGGRRIEFSNRVVVITGGSRGLGLLARQFAREGARLCLVARSREELEQARSDLRNASPNAPEPLLLTCDMTKPTDVAEAFKRIITAHSAIHVLVNNAGCSILGSGPPVRGRDQRFVSPRASCDVRNAGAARHSLACGHALAAGVAAGSHYRVGGTRCTCFRALLANVGAYCTDLCV